MHILNIEGAGGTFVKSVPFPGCCKTSGGKELRGNRQLDDRFEEEKECFNTHLYENNLINCLTTHLINIVDFYWWRWWS